MPYWNFEYTNNVTLNHGRRWKVAWIKAMQATGFTHLGQPPLFPALNNYKRLVYLCVVFSSAYYCTKFLHMLSIDK